VLDSSAGGEPLAYIQGHGNLVSGLEKALEGKQDGNTLAVVVRRKKATARAMKR
jgi:FKBP-type peptidyl-prolyl cis-trans isomerase SlyD